MRVANLMFGKSLGGLEQAAFDYHDALRRSDYQVVSYLHRDAALAPQFNAAEYDVIQLNPRAEWDWWAIRHLRRALKVQRAEVITAHGNRAIGLALRAAHSNIPVIGVAHNYQLRKRFPRCDAAFCVTRDLIEELIHLDMDRSRCFHIPNMIRPPDTPVTLHRQASPLTLGAMGRFVPKKGFDILLHALAALKQQAIDCKLLLAGDGPQAGELQALAKQLDIADHVIFTGWIDDKQAFFNRLDMFILPSHHEPFGIVLIEAMAAGLPCITTDTEGPCEIITQAKDAIMIPKNQPYQMAQTIRDLRVDPQRMLALAENARRTALDRYDIRQVSRQLETALDAVQALVSQHGEPI